MKRILLAIGIAAQFTMASMAHATVVYTDTAITWPGWLSSNPAQNSEDVVGHPDITGGTVSYNADRSLNTITVHNAGKSWSDLYPGDLFLNVVKNSTDTYWDYVLKLTDKTAGTYTLYDISGVGLSAVKGVGGLTEQYYDYTTTPSAPVEVRNDHPVAISPTLLNTRYYENQYGITTAGTAHFDGMTDGFDTAFEFDAGSVKIGEMGFILGWEPNCANDVLYEQIPAPEPGTMMLLGAGFLGLAIYGKRRKNA